MNIKSTYLRWGLSILIVSLIGAASMAQSQVIKSDTPSAPLYFDGTSGVRSFLVSAADMATGVAVNRITIAIDFEKFDGQTLGVNGGGLPLYNEIEFLLTNPQNVTTSLIAPNSFFAGSGGFRGVITFDDAATQAVNYDSNSLHTGTFRPTGSLGNLLTANGVGTWKLSIRDTFRQDHLGYYSSTLTLNSKNMTALTPELPSGVQAIPVLLAVGGMALYQRKKKAPSNN